MKATKLTVTDSELSVIRQSLASVGWRALPAEHPERKAYESLLHKVRATGGPPMNPEILNPEDPRAPKYWRTETSGVLIPLMETYLAGEPLDQKQVITMRAYLRQWIYSPVWIGQKIDTLRRRIDLIETNKDVRDWLELALDAGIDPL